MTDQTKPGWYPRPDMQDALGFWDGKKWTDQTQPARVTSDSRNRVTKWVTFAVIAGALGYGGYVAVSSDDELDCNTERAEAALEGQPRPDC